MLCSEHPEESLAICLPLKGGEMPLSAFSDGATHKLAGMFPSLS